MTTYDKIKSAIQNRHKIKAVYKKSTHELCPYILGTKGGRHHTLFYSLKGRSHEDNWQCIPIDELENVEIITTRWAKVKLPENFNPCIEDLDHMIDFMIDF